MSSPYKRPSDFGLIDDTKQCVKKMLRHQVVSPELRSAWDEFYDRYDPLVRRYAANCGVPPSGVADAAQSAWLGILHALTSFDCTPDRGRFRSWLFVQVRRTVVDQFRHDVRSIERDERVDVDDLPDSEPEPPCAFELQWDETVLHQALSHFQRYESEENFQLFYLRRFCQLPVRELAEDSGLSSTVIRQRLHRTSQTFDRLLTNFGYIELMFISPAEAS